MREDRAIERILRKAKAAAGELQPWPDYFESKARELATILNFYRFDKIGSILEIGCGNGFTAALLSNRALEVTAFDLPLADSTTHSIGLKVAKELIGRIGVKNVNLVGGSAENLPFPDGSFNMIFSEYMLHYVKRKGLALNQMRRVLKQGGVAITVVPNFTERILAPLIRYEYLLKRILSLIMNSGKDTASRDTPEDSGVGLNDRKGAPNIKRLSDHLFLRADGAYKSFMEEMSRHRPGAWKRLFEENGFMVEETFTTQLVPQGIFDILGAPAVRLISRQLNRFNKLLGNKPVIKSVGFSLGLVARKA